jgi:hypothetical protein
MNPYELQRFGVCRSPLAQTGTALKCPRDGARGRAQFCPQPIIESVSLKLHAISCPFFVLPFSFVRFRSM